MCMSLQPLFLLFWGKNFIKFRYSRYFRVIIPEVVLIQLSFLGWAQSCSKHVEDSNKHIIEEIVRQVGRLPDSYT